MKLALLSIIKPMKGSGDGPTEYAYQLQNALKKYGPVEPVYALNESKRNNVSGLVSMNMKMRLKARRVKCGYDIFHITNQEMGFLAKPLKKRCNVPVVTTVHDIARFQKGLQSGLLQGTYNRMVKSYVRDAVQNSDLLLFDSKLTMSEVYRKFGTRKNGVVVNLGINDVVINQPLKTKESRGRFNVGYLGSMARHKNVMLLLEAANIIEGDNYSFSIYGTGIEYKRLEEFRDRNGLESVKFMGFAPQAKMVQIYDSFDAFVFPSLYEGFGLPIIEAQARGLPVIIYKHGKISEEVRKYCFEAEDAAHMANIIYDLKENGYGAGLRRKATAYARSFTWERCAKNTLEAYKNALE